MLEMLFTEGNAGNTFHRRKCWKCFSLKEILFTEGNAGNAFHLRKCWKCFSLKEILEILFTAINT
jgi:hypothetical protein